MAGDDGAAPPAARILSGSAWAIAAVAVVGVVTAWLPWISGPGGGVSVVDAFDPADASRQLVVPLLVGAAIALPAGLAAALVADARRRAGLWALAALALLGQIVRMVQVLTTGHRLASRPDLPTLGVGWYLQLAAVVAGSTVLLVGAVALVQVVRRGPGAPPSARAGAAIGAALLGLATTWLFSRELFFMGAWAWDDPFVEPLPAPLRVAAWAVVVVGVAGPPLAVAAARHRGVATGLVAGWWAFLVVVVSGVAVALTDGYRLQDVATGFWIGAALAVAGGVGVLWWLSRTRPAPSTTDGSPRPVLDVDDIRRTDDDPLRR